MSSRRAASTTMRSSTSRSLSAMRSVVEWFRGLLRDSRWRRESLLAPMSSESEAEKDRGDQRCRPPDEAVTTRALASGKRAGRRVRQRRVSEPPGVVLGAPCTHDGRGAMCPEAGAVCKRAAWLRPVEWKQEERCTDHREGHGGQDRDLAHEQSVTTAHASNWPRVCRRREE